jgi:hypothetical protein
MYLMDKARLDVESSFASVYLRREKFRICGGDN